MTHYCTHPVASPKQPFEPRSEALDHDEIVDVSFLCGPTMTMQPGTPLPVAVSAAVWDAAADIPFRQLRNTTTERRLRAVVSRAVAAFERARTCLGHKFLHAMLSGFAVDFVVSLPCRSGDRSHIFLRLHCGPNEHGEIVVTLALPEELQP